MEFIVLSSDLLFTQYLDRFKKWKKQIEMFVIGELLVNHID